MFTEKSLSNTFSPKKSYAQISAELEPHVQKFKRVNSKKAIFCCPIHDDKTPSAWIEENQEGWTHAHCSVCGNLKELLQDWDILPRGRDRKAFVKAKETERNWLKTLQNKLQKFTSGVRITTRLAEVMAFDGETPTTYDIYPIEGQEWDRRWSALQQQRRMKAPRFGNWNDPESVEKRRQIALHYLRNERKLTGNLNGLLFSHCTLDDKLSREKQILWEEGNIGCVLITPLRSPNHEGEKGWQETWLDHEGKKLLRHFPAGIPQSGRFFWQRNPAHRTLVIGEGVESSLSGTAIVRQLGFAEDVDTMAVMSLAQFAKLEKIPAQYTKIVLCPDLEPHGKGLLAVLNMVARLLPLLPATVQIYLLRPDGKGITDPITDKLDANDQGLPDNLAIVPLDSQNILPPEHPMRQWSAQPLDEAQAQYELDLRDSLSRPATGTTEIHALGTGFGKSHAIAKEAANCSESVLVCAPTREGRKSLARHLDPDTQEHHSRAEALAGGDALADGETLTGGDALADGDLAESEAALQDPEQYCQIYQKTECEEKLEGIRVVVQHKETPSPALVSEVGFPASQICNTQCPHGLATLYAISNGAKGEDTGESLCIHMQKRLESWYLEVRLASTHAAVNGDKALIRQNEHLRSKIVIDEEPQWLEYRGITTETLYQMRLGLQKNYQIDKKFYAEADREEVLEAHEKMSLWLAHLERETLSGWKNGDLPPLPGHEWQEFHDLVEKHRSIAYVTRFERPHILSTENGSKQKVYTPVLLDWISGSIQNRTLFHDGLNTVLAYRATEIGKRIFANRRKQDFIITTATPSRLLLSLGKVTHQHYPATPNLEITWTRGKNWSKTYLDRKPQEAIQDAVEIMETLPSGSVLLTTKAYEERLPEASDFPDIMTGHWGMDDTGHNRYLNRTHMEVMGLQILPRQTYWMEYEAQRRIYQTDWEACTEEVEWTSQSVGIDYLPNSQTSCTLPDHADLTYFVRERHTRDIVQAVGRFRAARRPDEKLTVNLRCNIPPLPLYGLVIHHIDGHSNRQGGVHAKAVERVYQVTRLALELGMKPTFANVDRLAKERYGKGIRRANWRAVADTLIKESSIQGVRLPVSGELLWKLQSEQEIRELARTEGDKLRRAEAALPGRGDGPDGEALLDTLARMDAENCDSGTAAARILSEIAKNRHHHDERYLEMLQEIVMHPIPPDSWLFEEQDYGT